MAENDASTASHTLGILRKIDEGTERMAEDLRDCKVSMSSVEADLAGMNRRMDRCEERLDRIERRLKLSDAPAS